MVKSERFKCPECGWGCGRRAMFVKHLGEHGHDNEREAYIAYILDGAAPVCPCGCGKEPRFAGWNSGFRRWVDGHNANLSVLEPEEAERIRSARKATVKAAARPGWSRGLTKEGDERLAAAAVKRSRTMKRRFADGELQPWLKGLNKDGDERVADFSARLKQKFASGELRPWAKGKTKESDERVASMAISVKRTMLEEARRERFDRLKRLTPDEIAKRLRARCHDLELLSNLGEDYVRDRHRNLLFKCKSCGLEQRKSLLQALTNRCDACTPNMSAGQIELFRWLEGLNVGVSTCDRELIKPYELDVVVKDAKLALEYNGLYFHSEEFKDKDYHRLKLELARREGYRLIHVFEDEWRDRQEIVKSIILHALGMTERSVDARKCEIVEVDSRARKAFFDANHLDGDARASGAWGLVLNGEIVSCISVRKPLHRKHAGSLEICRFASVGRTNVRGGLGRLLRAVEKHCKQESIGSILTYVDTRFGEGSGYERVGFEMQGTTSNRFWWTDGKSRIDRFKIRADRNAGMTEQQVAEEHGVTKIWGCPNLVLLKELC